MTKREEVEQKVAGELGFSPEYTESQRAWLLAAQRNHFFVALVDSRLRVEEMEERYAIDYARTQELCIEIMQLKVERDELRELRRMEADAARSEIFALTKERDEARNKALEEAARLFKPSSDAFNIYHYPADYVIACILDLKQEKNQNE
jgi:hypothetical protein